MNQPSRFYRGTAALAGLLSLSTLALAAPGNPQQLQMFAVENALSGAGYPIDSADGVADASTGEALQAFQESQLNLTASGEVDEATLLALGVKRDNGGYDKDMAKKAAAEAKPSYDPTKDAAPAGKAGNGEDVAEEEDEGWLFSW